MSEAQRTQDLQRIEAEFRTIDIDGDGKVDKYEMNEFLEKKGVNSEHRDQIIDELFSKCDVDGDGRIDIQEFTGQYTDTMDQLLLREKELKGNIMDSHKNLKLAQSDLNAAKRQYGPNGPGGVTDEENTVFQAQAVVEQWNEAVAADVEVLKQVRIFIEQLKMPFGFLMD